MVTIAKIYNNIGDAYERIGLYKPAINFNQKALEVYINSKDTNGIISSYINMATSYILQDEFKKAKDLFELCEKYLTNSTSNYLVAKFYANYASLQLKMEQYEDALKNIEMSINLNNQINNQNSNLVNYINYAYILENLHKYKESYHSYKDAITIAKKLGNKQWEKQAYLGLATTASKMKMFETAFDNMMNYHNLKDSILSKEIEQKYAVSTANYTNRITYLENQNLLNKNKLLAKENLMVKNKLIITILVLLNILVGGGFFTVHIVNKIKKKNQLMLQNKYEKERNQLSKDLHDELGSDLTRITLYAEIIKNNTDSEIAVKIVNTSKKINENVRDLIWFINPENNQTKDLFIQLREFIYDATSDFNIECSIKTSCITNNKHTPKQSINISRIIKEVINNILKHAHAQKIDVSLVSDKHLEIQIFDNGNGFNTNASYQGNGLRNIQFRANQIGAKISFQSEFNKGTLFTFSL
ncbi:MAG: tetratricopeptide repeat protein [Flavobacteriales bacterium]|nr:tetratricopeptide repeat protein [Flavobacteriales bacterium]